jgi:hypothetical protein
MKKFSTIPTLTQDKLRSVETIRLREVTLIERELKVTCLGNLGAPSQCHKTQLKEEGTKRSRRQI